MTTDLIRAKQQLERHVLRLLADAYEANQDLCYLPLKMLETPEINREIVRAILIDLRKDGLATYAKGLWSDDGELAGSGYAVTPEGRNYLGELELNHGTDLQQALDDIRQLIHGAEEWCPFSVPELQNIEKQLLLLDAMDPDDIAAHEINEEREIAHIADCIDGAVASGQRDQLASENARLKKERDLLRKAIVRYGDHSRMGTVEPMELQQAIDAAFENKGGA
ncbi:hypothetical protein [uncultured Cohaesibacter sp.]|uniref:hypothetical protein n=1 Tax=uncultured Cohaesibacter sp. TaxID=1002546 RepID=UPI0029C820ED|nr:hypothetical protein [uncultured Cohaesibacter sp.]